MSGGAAATKACTCLPPRRGEPCALGGCGPRPGFGPPLRSDHSAGRPEPRSIPAPPNCLAHWDESGWEFALTGFFASRNGWGSWPTTADQLVGYLAKHGLPAARGVLYCDIAGDGLPTTLTWADGGQAYSTSMYHSAIGAIEMAEAMAPYPRPGGRRDAPATLPRPP